MLNKKMLKKNIIFGEKLVKLKTSKSSKGPHYKSQTPIGWKLLLKAKQ